MTTSSPLEKAIQGLSVTGWMLRSLSKGPFNCARPWSCELYPGHFGGSFYPGRKVTSSVLTGGMRTIVADGATPLEAVRNAVALLDKSDAKAVYEDLERAFEDRLDAAQAT